MCSSAYTIKFEINHLGNIDILYNLLAIKMKISSSAGDFTGVIYEGLIYDLLNSKILIDVLLNQRVEAAN